MNQKNVNRKDTFKVPEIPAPRRSKTTTTETPLSPRIVEQEPQQGVVVTTSLHRRLSDSALTQRRHHPNGQQILPFTQPMDFQQLVAALAQSNVTVKFQSVTTNNNYYQQPATETAVVHVVQTPEQPKPPKRCCSRLVSGLFHPAPVFTIGSALFIYLTFQSELVHVRNLVRQLIQMEILGRTIAIFDTEALALGAVRGLGLMGLIMGIIATCFVCYREILRCLGIREN